MLMPSIFGENLMDDLFDLGCTPVRNFTFSATPEGIMKTDIKETETSYDFMISMPGVSKDDVKAELHDGYLTVSATTKREDDEKDDKGKYIRRERYVGSQSRSFYVGDHVHEEDIHAKLDNGVLTLEVPKEDPKKIEEQEKKYIAIEG